MMNQIFTNNNKILHTLLKLGLLVVLLVGAIGVQAWIGRPSGAPTTCPDDHVGCNYPLTVGSDAQAKKGRLVVGTTTVPTDINDSLVIKDLAALDILSVWGDSRLSTTGSSVSIGGEDQPRELYVFGNLYIQSVRPGTGTVPVCAEQTGRLVQCPAAVTPPSVDLKVSATVTGTYVDAGKAFVVDRPGFATWSGVASNDKKIFANLLTTNVTSCTFTHDLLNSTSDANTLWTSLTGTLTTFSGKEIELQAFGLSQFTVKCTGNDGNEYSDSATIAVTGSKVYNANSSFTVPSNVVTLTMSAGAGGGGGGGGADGGDPGVDGGDSCVIPGSSGSCGGTEIIRAEGGKGGFEGGGGGANSPVGAGGSGYPGFGVTIYPGVAGNSNGGPSGKSGGNGGAGGAVPGLLTAGKGGKGFNASSQGGYSGGAGGGGGAAISRTMTVVPATTYYAVVGNGGIAGIKGTGDTGGTVGTAGAKGSVLFSW